jgi:hypothetical protein
MKQLDIFAPVKGHAGYMGEATATNQPPPAFDGATLEPERDGARLGQQLVAVSDLMRDGAWRTLAQISDATNCPEASVSARLRDLRKPKFGGFRVEREYVERGLFRYRVLTPFSP